MSSVNGSSVNSSKVDSHTTEGHGVIRYGTHSELKKKDPHYQFAASYDVNEHGIISNPGSMEGESLYTPYFYSQMCDGWSQETIYDENGDVDHDIFLVSKYDRMLFPELAGIDKVMLFTDSQGFVYCLPAGIHEE